MKKVLKQARKGFSLVELLIAVVVLGILGAMLLAAGTAAQTKARVAVASNDIDSVRNAVYTAFTMNASFMQKKDNADTFKALVEAINAELDENWEWELLNDGTVDKSGAIAQTKVQRDPWNNPYTLYCYTDTHTTKYAANRGDTWAEKVVHLVDADSCMYVVIASAGPNGTGVGQGIDGAPAGPNDMVNNSDGIDDIGVVIRLLNGSTTMATFGWQNAALGTLEFCNWYFCGQNAGDVAGRWTELTSTGAVTECATPPTYGSSLDLFPNLENLKSYTPAANATKNAPCKIGDTATDFGGSPTP